MGGVTRRMRNPDSVDHAAVCDDGRMTSILGDLSPAAFLRRYWQRRPLLIRQALPGFAGLLDRDALLGLAARGDAISRLVVDHGHGHGGRRRRWERHDGPFLQIDPSRLPARGWTVLVHGVESLIPGGWELLGAFSFIPAARIDDLMVSYAAPGGSVGPHDDLYDVFLLQGPGRRRWRVSSGGDRTLDPDAAIKVLQSFVPDEEWLLEPGDMLYLPPGVAHHGVAEEACFTYSIGFRAPSYVELVHSFLGYLANALAIDPDALLDMGRAAASTDSLDLGAQLVAEVASALGGIRWDRALVEEFAGCFLTRPKPHVRFLPPARTLSPEAFARRLRGRGRLTLALPSRGLVRGRLLFLNGEAHPASRASLRLFGRLVRERALPLPLEPDRRMGALLYSWYAAGYLGLGHNSAGGVSYE
jgi:50S ribosomal protein L16 3-hydroxylase